MSGKKGVELLTLQVDAQPLRAQGFSLQVCLEHV